MESLMKTLVILSAMSLSLSAGATDLITLTRSSGLSTIPTSSQVSVNENGKIIRVKRIRAVVTKETLGQLSATTVQSLKDNIEGIDDNAKLVDQNPKAPKCMNSPSATITVNKGGKEITLSTKNSCHTSTVDDAIAYSLISAIEGLSFL